MEYYIGVRADYGGRFRSPFRKDVNPTCTYNFFSGRPRFRDWSESESLDCFDVVMRHYSCTYRTALEKIAFDFGLSGTEPDVQKITLAMERRKKAFHSGERAEIAVTVRPYRNRDLEYFSQYAIDDHCLARFGVHSIDKLWVNDKEIYWGSKDDPAVGYFFGEKNGRALWKIYFYTRETHRFLCNTTRMQGFLQLPSRGDLLVITKSLKDVMVLSNLMIPAVAPQGETQRIIPPVLGNLRERFTDIYSFYDFDLAGVRAANRMWKEDGIPYVFLTPEYGAKDVSDLVKLKGMEHVRNVGKEWQKVRNKSTMKRIEQNTKHGSVTSTESGVPW